MVNSSIHPVIMKKNILYLAISMVLAMNTSIAQQQEQKPLENSLLWKIEKEGHKTGYLFGTIHLLSEEQFVIKEKVQKALSVWG